MLLAAAILLIVLGNLLQAHAAISHLREPRPPLAQTPDVYWNTAYYTPTGRRLVRLATWILYPTALALIIVFVTRAVTGTAEDTQRDAFTSAPCRLEGRWSLRLEREARSSAIGSLTLTDTVAESERYTTWQGRYRLDPSPLFGESEGGVNSMSVGEGSEEEIRFGVRATLRDSTRVGVSLSPLISHGPLNLGGTLQHDSVVGEWEQRSEDAMNAPRGTFVMWRESPCSSAARVRHNKSRRGESR